MLCLLAVCRHCTYTRPKAFAVHEAPLCCCCLSLFGAARTSYQILCAMCCSSLQDTAGHELALGWRQDRS
jgi:hypothetical protein